MPRKANTDTQGKKFKAAIKNKVWKKAAKVKGHPAEIWRKDILGNTINRQEFGNRDSKYGWEIDHIVPVSAGGTDDPDNLQALHWKANEAKGDQHP